MPSRHPPVSLKGLSQECISAKKLTLDQYARLRLKSAVDCLNDITLRLQFGKLEIENLQSSFGSFELSMSSYWKAKQKIFQLKLDSVKNEFLKKS